MFFILGDPGAVKILLKFSTNFFKSKFQETLPMIMTNKITKALLLIIGMNENENDYATPMMMTVAQLYSCMILSV